MSRLATGYALRRIVGRYIAFALFVLVLLTLIPTSPSHRPDRASLLSPNEDELSPNPEQNSTFPRLMEPQALLEPPKPPSCGVIKASMLYGGHKFAQLEDALQSHRRHSERWGCGFQSLRQELTDRRLYSKHYYLLSILLQQLELPAGKRAEWLMWIDADSIVVNPAISPSAFLPPTELGHVFALVTADHHGLNIGIFYLRVHHRSVDLLTQVVDFSLANPHIDLGWSEDQAAMERVILSMEGHIKDSGDLPGIAWVPRVWFNAFQWEHGFEGSPGHFIVHFAGLGQSRIAHMASWLEELGRNQRKWEIPFEETFYGDAIAKYWSEFAANASSFA